MSDFWYKNAVIYEVEVGTFMDADGDGVGDFEGLIGRLDYLASLGVTCLWLLPFYPSPGRDGGYDVTDYYGVDPRYGTLGDVVEFLREADDRGIRVLIDLVIQHTSDQHPWFQAALRDPRSPYRDYYVWSDRPLPSRHVIFPGEQERNWTYAPEARAYYRHTFYPFQPDLNFFNPKVRNEIRKIMGFWLQLGVSGFRVDAVPFLLDPQGIEGADPDRSHEYLRELRDFLNVRRGDAIFLAEADHDPRSVDTFFGHGDQMHMVLNFIVNELLALALACEDAEPLRRALAALPDIPRVAQWANFIRNHDELNLGKLSAREREAVFERFAPAPEMRIYGRGIRRRLAPMLGGDRRRLELAYSLLFTLPGAPVLLYGEEIGMGEDLDLPGRMSVRTLMQWSSEHAGGFSTAPDHALARPPIPDGPYGYERVNVARQRRDPRSLLRWMESLIHARRECPEFGWGSWRVLDADPPTVFALHAEWEGGAVVAAHNLAGEAVSARIDLGEHADDLLATLFSDSATDPAPAQRADEPIALGPYGFRWFRVAGEHRQAARTLGAASALEQRAVEPR